MTKARVREEKGYSNEGLTLNQLRDLGFTHYCPKCYRSFKPEDEPCDCGVGLRRL